MIGLNEIRDARQRIAGRVHVTPTMSASRIGQRVGVQLVLKCENLQKTGSFKVRGVVTVSAGNHAQALAWGARSAGIHAVVVMPELASPAKVDASRGYGAEVVLHGASSIQAIARAHELAKERDLVFVHPFDDDQICAGAGTAGMELVEQAGDLDAIVIPIGGGGLISGMAVAIKEMNPGIRVFGVEPRGAPSTRLSLDSGRAVTLESVNTIADGLAAPMTGQINYEIIRRYVDDVVLIDDDVIAEGVRELLVSAKLLAEPAGAAATAAVVTRAIPLRDGMRVAAVVSGGNFALDRLKSLL